MQAIKKLEIHQPAPKSHDFSNPHKVIYNAVMLNYLNIEMPITLMDRIHLGILLGILAGIIDVIPMIMQNLTWDANISAFSLWVISGFLIATTNLRIKGIMRGIIIPFLVLLPSAILIGWKEPYSLIPIFVMTLILGSALGFLIEKYGR